MRYGRNRRDWWLWIHRSRPAAKAQVVAQSVAFLFKLFMFS